ncbi:hypothetical protein [Olleya sp. R77988]|uniref:hypothetical protein n=1 Tax=Olleya sp. R77988 TaxID=3093875 RepID=UPI0037C91116
MKKLVTLCFCLSILSFTSCEDILECVINRRPELPDISLEEGYLQQIYNQQFDAGIKNEPRDNNYDYYFELVGDLPDGLDMYIDFRTVIFEGIPLNRGVFEFTLYLDVDPPVYYDEETGDYEDAMCSYSTSENYTIIIN